MDKIKIGNYLKDLRKKKRRVDGKPFTQADLSDALASAGLEVSINGINEWESGKSLPSPEKLDFLSKIYNKIIDEILEGEDINQVDYKKVYFIYNNDWFNTVVDEDKIFPMNQEQILKVYNRFRELSKIIINRPLSSNEEKEYKFLFEHFYSLTDYHYNYCKINANNSFLRLMDSINQMRIEVCNMTDDEKYWEVQKLYEEIDDNNYRFSHWRNMDDLVTNEEKDPNVIYIKNRFEALDNWQKDMFLAMFQNIEGYDRTPDKWGADHLKRYEAENGEYNHDDRIKEEMKYLINHGASYNKWFLNCYQKKIEKKRIIDRLEELYNMCLKPIEIAVQNHETDKREIVKIENTVKNRFINNYYFYLSGLLKYKKDTDSSYSDLQQTFDYFTTHDEIDDETRKRIAELENIDTNKEKKYWMADYKQRIGYMEDRYVEYKDKEKQIEEGLKEIKKLEDLLKSGEKEYSYESLEMLGGTDEKSIREWIVYWKSKLDYSEYLRTRDLKKTKELLLDLENLSLAEIKEKYFKMEVIDNE